VRLWVRCNSGRKISSKYESTRSSAACTRWRDKAKAFEKEDSRVLESLLKGLEACGEEEEEEAEVEVAAALTAEALAAEVAVAVSILAPRKRSCQMASSSSSRDIVVAVATEVPHDSIGNVLAMERDVSLDDVAQGDASRVS